MRRTNNLHVAATVMGVFGVVVMAAVLVDGTMRGPRVPAGDTMVVCRPFAIDGCQYLLPEGSDTLTHRADCRNPIHWERVLSDTSWWWKVRAKGDTN